MLKGASKWTMLGAFRLEHCEEYSSSLKRIQETLIFSAVSGNLFRRNKWLK